MGYNLENRLSYGWAYKNMEMVIYLLMGFLAPLFIGHPQIVVGATVNAILATSALRKISVNKAIALAITPSLGVVMQGILFGNLTKFIIYFIPIIWISNIIYMTIIRWNVKDNSEKKNTVFITFIKKNSQTNKLRAIVGASVVKTALLFGTAFILVMTNVVPKPFLVAMGGIQILTAIIGGSAAIGITYLLSIPSRNRN